MRRLFKPRHQVGAEEAGSVFLHQQDVVWLHRQPRIDFDRVGAGGERARAFLLERPNAGILDVGFLVHHRGENNRNAALVRDLKERFLRLDLAVEACAERHCRIGEALEHIDDDQRRPLAKTDLDAKATLPEKLLVILAAGHDPHSFSLAQLYANNYAVKTGGSE